MKEFGGKVAAITGAGSGIGQALALELAKRGCDLALSDIDEAGLASTSQQLSTAGVTVRTDVVDVADRLAVDAWAQTVTSDFGRINLVVNNAGVALGSSIEAMRPEDLEWLMNINFFGVVWGTQAFLPALKESGDGHIVNISSVFGLISVPSQSAYNAAKFAVRGFTDALRIELEIEQCGVSCTTVHPGGIKTNIARSARIDDSVSAFGTDPKDARRDFERAFITSPTRAARQILRGVERNRRRVLVGPDAKVIDLLSRFPAALTQELLVFGGRRQRQR